MHYSFTDMTTVGVKGLMSCRLNVMGALSISQMTPVHECRRS